MAERTWDTPYGKNARYTVRLHVVGDGLDLQRQTVRGTDREVEYRVVTPHGELKAAALAAGRFSAELPDSIYAEIEIVHTEYDFNPEPGDYRDRDSFAR